MLLKSVLKEAIHDVLTDHDLDGADDLEEDLIDRISGIAEVVDDEDAEESPEPTDG